VLAGAKPDVPALVITNLKHQITLFSDAVSKRFYVVKIVGAT
jgi:hypothetical protein